MTGEKNMNVGSVLPLDARSARIAAGGGLASSVRRAPAGRDAGCGPDGTDCIMPQAAGSRAAASRAVPAPAIQPAPVPNDNPI